MPKRISVDLEATPYLHKGKYIRMSKAFTGQDFTGNTILTDDVYTYVEFFFEGHKKPMKYMDLAKKEKLGDPNKYHYSFYWKQSRAFYQAAKVSPIETSPLASYYAMLNAVKAYISFRESDSTDNFVNAFNGHGLHESSESIGESLDTILVKRNTWGVFVHFAKLLDSSFETAWPQGKVLQIKTLLYNLSFVHRAFITTYSTPKGKKIPELFLPLKNGISPTYHKANNANLYLRFELDRGRFAPSNQQLPASIMHSVPKAFEECDDYPFVLKSVAGAHRNTGSISGELKNLNSELRRKFQYVRSQNRLWYLKKENASSDIVDTCSMLLIFAAMHRFSEIVRYKPEQLERIMKSKENWLVHEFLALALDQFIDEIAAEITKQDIMCTGVKV